MKQITKKDRKIIQTTYDKTHVKDIIATITGRQIIFTESTSGGLWL